MLAVARLYRDQLGWAVHPLRARDDQRVPEADRGKAPLLSGWHKWRVENVTDEILAQYFGDGQHFNLGIVVRPPFVVVDIDSHKDQGQSAAVFINSHPELAKVPRERTAGGCHLYYLCRDLPPFPNRNALNAKVNENVSTELYHDGQNIVATPSVHRSGYVYRWEVVGEIPAIAWAELKRIFGFTEPVDEPKGRGRKTKAKCWWTKLKGNLKTLNIVSLARELDIYGEPIDADEKKHSVRCPWCDEHSDKVESWKPSDSSTCVWEAKGDQSPSFKCLHSGASNHAETKHIEHLLDWAEGRKPGIVDSLCAEKRVYAEGATTADGRPQVVVFGLGKELSAFAAEVGRIVAPKHQFFVRGNAVVVVRQQRLSESVKFLAFHEVTAVEMCSEIEKYIEVGRLFKDEAGQMVFTPCSLNREQAATCDTEMHILGEFNAASPFKPQQHRLPGGGGTDFRRPFEYACKNRYEQVIYLTDTEGTFPKPSAFQFQQQSSNEQRRNQTHHKTRYPRGLLDHGRQEIHNPNPPGLGLRGL